MQIETKIVKVTIPPKLLIDKDVPVPQENALMQSDTASYQVELFEFALECKENKRDIKKIVERFEDEKE